jgi:hypothetical protein
VEGGETIRARGLRQLRVLAKQLLEPLGVAHRGGLEDVERPGLGGKLSGTIALALVEGLEDRPELASHRPGV